MLPKVKLASPDGLEAKAYAAIADIPTLELNDRNRLGYHVYLFLNKECATLREAVHVAQARMSISDDEAVKRIAAALREEGFTVDA
jgi:hypothetical protein